MAALRAPKGEPRHAPPAPQLLDSAFGRLVEYAPLRRLIPALLLLAALPLAAAEVYRYVDDDGNVVYTDRPVPGAELVNVDASFIGDGPRPRPSPTASSSSSGSGEPGSGSGNAGNGGGGSASGETGPDELTPEQRAQNCERARERRERYTSSRRLYRTTADGEREYLSSEEIDEARAQAAADVEQWCN